MNVTGIVLAAGAGRRFGGPKGLARCADGTPWVALAVRALQDGGCDDVAVIVGAAADDIARIVPTDARVVVAEDWALGVSASLRAGLAAASDADAVVVSTVDTPDASPLAVARVLASGAELVQAVYRGTPGHPVVISRAHFAPLAAAVSGDRGARPYLVTHGVVEVECGDLSSGDDVDAPD
ncbi:nucleotidyltransferase family protein [Microbacterium aoyamense]|uniref:Nucleotidyltransferase family protein n=1 Tax=Microbacterium aoyamense TaxID=344166 RepID=A0ABN2PHC1_9MICO|nr:NTP transferase domain-containing protein [Microbacterium aoyamense]